jgi:hypothetical protein
MLEDVFCGLNMQPNKYIINYNHTRLVLTELLAVYLVAVSIMALYKIGCGGITEVAE